VCQLVSWQLARKQFSGTHLFYMIPSMQVMSRMSNDTIAIPVFWIAQHESDPITELTKNWPASARSHDSILV
jgi:hypothetical protein